MPLPRAMSVSEAKNKFHEVLEMAKAGETIEISRRSKPEAIVLGIAAYQELLEVIGDLEDALAILEGERASEGKPLRDWEEVKAAYRAKHPDADV